jgi:hypothetical protein
VEKIFFVGCSQSRQTYSKVTTAERLWYKTEYEYKANDLSVYKMSLDARNQLEKYQKTRPEDLDYSYCLAFLNGRLFLMAKSLGKTNAANQFLLESGYCFNENRKQANLPMTNFSAETIEYYIEVRDARMHPNQTNGVP